ncbi:MAG: RNA-binding protein [Candidatus Marinimicrobia bacterium]|nr:RNA-binding protein [Candidatus Neomarinimicrobiota bacterium]|tara:strand:+ start:74 stop:307 length:234 start_codon:yes stop_codon:yes gene_type:complete
MKELLESMVKAIVDSPDDVEIDETESENTTIYELRLGDGDLGKVIGKKGKNIGAIRTIISAATAKEGGKRSIIEIIE